MATASQGDDGVRHAAEDLPWAMKDARLRDPQRSM